MNVTLSNIIIILSLISVFQTAVMAQECDPLLVVEEKYTSVSVTQSAQKAFDLYSENQFDGAISILKAITPNTAYDKAYINKFIGSIMTQKGEAFYEDASLYIKKAVDAGVLNQSDQLAQTKLLADLSASLPDKLQQTVDYYRWWLEKSCEQNIDVYLRMAISYSTLKEFEPMLSYAQKAIKIKPSKNAYLLAMSAHYELKQYSQAANYSRMIYSLSPQENLHKANEIKFYLLADDYDKAKAIFLDASKLNIFDTKSPKDVGLFRTMAQAFAAAKQHAIAFYLYKVILPASENVESDVGGMIMSLMPNKSEDVDLLLDAIQRFSAPKSHAQLYSQLGQYVVYNLYFEKGIAILQQALSFNQPEFEFVNQFYLAQGYHLKGDAEIAKQHLNKAYAVKDLTDEQRQKLDDLKKKLNDKI